MQSALKEAQVVIEREEIIRLSPRDWSWLLELIENPPKPNAKLTAAMKRYQKAKQSDADSGNHNRQRFDYGRQDVERDCPLAS